MRPTAANYAGLLESIHGTLAALDTTDYRWEASDRWTQARLDGTATRHLETWVFLGAMTGFYPNETHHDATMVIWLRRQSRDDSLSQARAHAAVMAAVEALVDWDFGGAGATPSGYTLESEVSEWAEASISFTISIPRG